MRALRKPFMVAVIAAAAFGVVQPLRPGTRRATTSWSTSRARARRGTRRRRRRRRGDRRGEQRGRRRHRALDRGRLRAARQAEDALVGAATTGRSAGAGRPEARRSRRDPDEARRCRQRPPREPTEPFAGAQWDMRMIGATPERLLRAPAGRGRARSASSTPASRPRTRTSRRTSTPSCRATSRSTSRGAEGERRRAVRRGARRVVRGPGRRRRGRPRHARRRHDRRRRSTAVGIAGVAPKVELVNLRAGQDSGYFFLQPTLDALTYAGDNGIDVVNMSFYIDPWLYNCRANPADSPAEQAQQRSIIDATQRALATPATTASRWSRPRATATPTSASRSSTTRARTTRRRPARASARSTTRA